MNIFGACRKRLATCVVHYGGAGQRLTRPRRDSPKTAEDTICNIYIRREYSATRITLPKPPKTWVQCLYHLHSGLHKLWYPGIRDTSTWSKFGAHGKHRDVFPFSNLGALLFSENLIRYSLHVCLREVKNNLFSYKHSYLRHFSWRF